MEVGEKTFTLRVLPDTGDHPLSIDLTYIERLDKSMGQSVSKCA